MVTLTLLDPQAPIPAKRWRFDSESVIRIGRSPDNHVILDSSLVSRHHLELRRTDATDCNSPWQVINQGKNGTFLNGILVSQGLVLDGALIQLAQGGPTLKFQTQATTVQNRAPLLQGCLHLGNSPDDLFCIYCGQPIRVERAIRHYQILRSLGQGGMGVTYLAWDTNQAIAQGTGQQRQLLAPVRVLKEMNADLREVPKAQELFEREARILKNLHHPGIPKFFDTFSEDGKKYLVMELIHGQDLEQRVYQQGPMSLKEAVRCMIQTCEVLAYLHQQRPPIIHRDIKPANLIMRYSDQRIIVLDFGAVKEIGTPIGTRIGAEGYSAPEQEEGRPVTQSDLFAIGCTLLFLVTGESPHKFYQQVGTSYRLSAANIPAVPRSLQQIIERVTHPDVQERYQTASELAQALSSYL